MTIYGNATNIMTLFQLLVERDPTEYATDPETFSSLKRSNVERLGILGEMLSTLSIDTGTGSAPILTSCFMVSKNEVSLSMSDYFNC